MSNSVSAVHASEMKKAGSASAQDSVASLQFSNTIVAYTILRVSFGANIMLHGVSRLLAGHAAFLAYLNHYFEKAPIVPASMLPAFASVLPWVETTLGLLLILGLATRFSLIVGGLVITCLVIGTNLAQDWLVSGLQLIYAFLYYYLLAHFEQNLLSVDGFSQR